MKIFVHHVRDTNSSDIFSILKENTNLSTNYEKGFSFGTSKNVLRNTDLYKS